MNQEGSVFDVLFRRNDIRGVYGKELTPQAVYIIARAAAIFLKSKKCIVGHDMRLSSDSLANAFIRGMRDQGVSIIDIGRVDTPAVYFASGKFKIAAAMITASHNPAQFNGIKIVKAGALPVGETTGLLNIKEIAQQFLFPKPRKRGTLVKKDIRPIYTKYVRSYISTKNITSLRAVVDAGNGMGGELVPRVFKGLPIKVIPLYFKLDGSFPNHIPNPAIYEATAQARKKVVETKAEFGMLFDGDADRVFFVDENGKLASSSVIGALLTDHLALKFKGKGIVYNVPCGKVAAEVAQTKKILAFRSAVGHTYMKKNMREHDAFFGCEHSGHFYFKQNYYADSAIITALLVCEIFSKMKKQGVTFSQMLSGYDRYAAYEEKNIKVYDQGTSLYLLESQYKKLKPLKIDSFDGLTMQFSNWWFNVRPSRSGEQFLRVNVEANDLPTLKKQRELLLHFIRKHAHARP